MEYLVYSILTLGGFFVGYWLRKWLTYTKISGAEAKAEKILEEAKPKPIYLEVAK